MLDGVSIDVQLKDPVGQTDRPYLSDSQTGGYRDPIFLHDLFPC